MNIRPTHTLVRAEIKRRGLKIKNIAEATGIAYTNLSTYLNKGMGIGRELEYKLLAYMNMEATVIEEGFLLLLFLCQNVKSSLFR